MDKCNHCGQMIQEDKNESSYENDSKNDSKIKDDVLSELIELMESSVGSKLKPKEKKNPFDKEEDEED